MLDTLAGLHIEPTNICTLKCAGCARTRFIEQWPHRWKNHNLDIDALMRFLDIDLARKRVMFCGNYGDPIYHPDFIDMVREFKKKNSHVMITTNGSYRKPEWWEELCSVLDKDDQVCFSIDGMPDNFFMYRENADWKSIEQGIRICAQHPVSTEWRFIPFQFNQDQIDQARELSRDLGVDQFSVFLSDRFDERTQHLIPTKKELVGSRQVVQTAFKQGKPGSSVEPKCYDNQQHIITATGHYAPCCYISDHRFYYKTMFGKDLDEFDITRTTLTRILTGPKVVNFFTKMPTEPITACQYNCPGV